MRPDKFSLKLHAGQAKVWRSKSRFKVIVAGRRWGKTQLAKTAIIKKSSIPKRLIWYVAPSYPMAKDIMWPELLETIPRRWIYKINHTKMSIRLVNKTTIMLKGADNPDSLRGVGLDFVVLDEFQDMHYDTWRKAIRPTLATTGGECMFIGTPKSHNHLYELYMLGQNKNLTKANRWESWQFMSIDSPFVPQSEIDEARTELDTKSFKQEFEASFEEAGGRVYYPFKRETHVSSDIAFNPSLPIWVGQDFNRDPMSSVIMQQQPDGVVWVVDEIHIKNSNTEEVVTELERRYWRYIGQTAIFPDPAAGYSQHARGETDLDIFRERGYNKLYFRRKHPPVADRVNCVNRMLMSARGEIKVMFNPKCEQIINSLEKTSYKEGTRLVDKEMSVEHAADAFGYCIEYRFPMRKMIIAGVSI
tara:strand:- start:2435 stop:3685 length:1251 start_codon:yes stop_codon:yes gene_type:complete